MIRKWIAKNFFSDIINEEAREYNKILLDREEKLSKEYLDLKYKKYSTKAVIQALRGRIFTEDELNELTMILHAGKMRTTPTGKEK